MQNAIKEIQDDLVKQIAFFQEIGKPYEAKRLEERTELDLEMIKELGYCSESKTIPVIWTEEKQGPDLSAFWITFRKII